MSRRGNPKVTRKHKLDMKERRDQHLFAKPVQIIQAVATCQRSNLQQNKQKNGEKPVPSPEWLRGLQKWKKSPWICFLFYKDKNTTWEPVTVKQ